MAIELHHLHPGHDDEVSRLKARIAELEKENGKLRSKNEGTLYALADAETDLAMSQRWRKCSEEKPNEEQFVLAYLTEDGKRGFFLTSCFIGGEFLIGEDPHGCKPTYWMPLPSAPKEGE